MCVYTFVVVSLFVYFLTFSDFSFAGRERERERSGRKKINKFRFQERELHLISNSTARE